MATAVASRPPATTESRAPAPRPEAGQSHVVGGMGALGVRCRLHRCVRLVAYSRHPGAGLRQRLSHVLRVLYHRAIAGGNVALPFISYDSYPPLVHVLGAITIFIAGMHPMALILSSNVVFVPLLAFACYGTGKIVAGKRAGLLAGCSRSVSRCSFR